MKQNFIYGFQLVDRNIYIYIQDNDLNVLRYRLGDQFYSLDGNNVLTDVYKYVSTNAKKIPFTKDTSVKQALEIIYKNIGNVKTDEKMHKRARALFDDKINLHNAYVNVNRYKYIIDELCYFLPQGVMAIVSGKKYPATAILHDFARGVDRKKIIKEIEALPFYLQKRLRKFCTENNFMWDKDITYKEYITILKEEKNKFRGSLTKKECDEFVAYIADELLRDAAKYEYFKKTGNKDIFFSKMQQMSIDSMTDKELAETYAPTSKQRFDSALVIKERIEKLIKENNFKKIQEFIGDVHHHSISSFVNPAITRMMFNTLKPHFNKFKQSDKIKRYLAGMLDRSRDAKLEQEISETFQVNIRQWANEKTTKEKIKENKERIKKSLVNAAKRISSGDTVSDTVILEKISNLEKKYGVIAGPETFNKTKQAQQPTKAQLEILKRFSGRNQ